VGALFRNGGGVFGGNGFWVRHGGESFSALSWRVTIHHSGGEENARALLSLAAINLQEANGWRRCAGFGEPS
jgi:hypothetical protein